MEQGIITYEKYLNKKSHQGSEDHWVKNIVRFLIPFDLLDKIWCSYRSDGKHTSSVVVESNTYQYEIHEIHENESDDSRMFYLIHIHISNNKNDWDKMITLFDDFKIVFNKKGDFLSAYPLGHDCEQPTLEILEKQLLNQEFDKLTAYNSNHFNDFLAMLLIQNIANKAKIKAQYSYPHPTVEPITQTIKIADSDNRRHQILYAFEKKDADAMVDEFAPDGKRDVYLRKHYRHIVYFVNKDFENSGHKKKENVNAESISIKAFMSNLQIPHNEWIKYELSVLYLTYNNNREKLDWLNNPYAFSHFQNQIKDNAISKKENEPISDSLFQDALNTLSTTNHLNNIVDYFQFLCAANLVNRKYNDIIIPNKEKIKNGQPYDKKKYFEANNKMIGFKYHIFNVFRTWIQQKKNVYEYLFWPYHLH